MWYLIDSGYQTGAYNMEADLALAHRCSGDDVYLRLYRWKPWCISLGANQDFSSVAADKTNAAGYDVVKRPTGGRAILHAEEITYAVVLTTQTAGSPREIYEAINLALLKGLALYDPRLSSAELETSQPDFAALYKKQSSAICFASSAKSELKFAGKKVIGSAQRKLGGKILQHGSILCGTAHREIVDFLSLDDAAAKEVAETLREKTVEIETILGEPVDYDKLRQMICKGFENHFEQRLHVVSGRMLEDELNGAAGRP